MKRLAIVFLAFALGLTIAGCRRDDDEIKIGLIVSAAGAHDMGYNQFAIEGLEAAGEEHGIHTHVVTTPEDIPGSLEALAEDGYDLIFSLEYNFDALIHDDGTGQGIAARYPDTIFVIFNDFANTDGDGNKIHDNVIEILFNVNEGSFLAGAAAALVNEYHDVLFDDDDYDFEPNDGTRTVGFVGGSMSPGILVFNWGFSQGINYIASEYDVQYRIFEIHDAGFAPSSSNYDTIDSFYDSGANVVYAAAGGVNVNLRSAAEDNKRLMIDVDADLDGEQPGRVLTSVLKNTNVPVRELIDMFVDGELEGGVDYLYDLDSGAAGITDMSVIAEYIKDTTEAQDAWDYIMGRIDEIHDLIADGTIDVVNAQIGETLDYADLSHLTRAN